MKAGDNKNMDKKDEKPRKWRALAYNETGQVISSVTIHGEITRDEAEKLAAEVAKDLGAASSGVQHR